jgi:hypothetical protein
MSGVRGRAGWWNRDIRCQFTVGLALSCALVITFAIGVAVLASPATATLDGGYYEHGENATDDESPSLANGSKINDTAIKVTITDNHDVDESTIGASSFVMTPGSINGSSVSDSGSDATVELSLADPVDEDEVTIGLADGSSVQDTNGNAVDPLDEPSITVTGMDGISPDVRSFTATDALGEPAQLTIETTEDLGGINVSILGDSGDWLTESDFTASGTTYETTYEPTTTGGIRFILVNVTDEAGNTQPVNIRQSVRADLTPPTAVAGLDLAASGNLTLSFTGGQSSDASGVANYTWSFGDGSNATGERVSHTFMPGNYTVTMTATDPFGNAATDSLDLNLTAGAGNVTDVSNETLQDIGRAGEQAVTVQRSETTGESALARVRRASAGEPFTISDEGAPLVRHDGISVHSLNVTLAENTSLDLAVSATGPGSVGDAAEATNTTALGGLTVVHSVPDEAVEDVEFAFTVEASELDAVGDSPDSVLLVRLHEGTWQTVPTSVTNGTNPYQFRANTSGFSRFAIVADAADQAAAATTTPTPTNRSTPTATPTQTPTDETETGTGTGAETGTGTESSIRIQRVSLNQSSVPPNQPVSVNVTLQNTGGDPGSFVAGLVVNDSVVATQTTNLPPNETRRLRFEYRTNQTGTFPVAVNGTTAGELTVGGGGLLSSILGIFGFLPLGLLQPLLMFVIAPLLVIFLLLKAIAYYMGY